MKGHFRHPELHNGLHVFRRNLESTKASVEGGSDFSAVRMRLSGVRPPLSLDGQVRFVKLCRRNTDFGHALRRRVRYGHDQQDPATVPGAQDHRHHAYATQAAVPYSKSVTKTKLRSQIKDIPYTPQGCLFYWPKTAREQFDLHHGPVIAEGIA